MTDVPTAPSQATAHLVDAMPARGPILAATPPMGWNSWNRFGLEIDARTVMETADAIVSSGLRDLGFRYVVVDDGWSRKDGRDSNGDLVPNPERFPDGIKSVADHVHSLGLLFGIYSDAAELTCGKFPGSFGFEHQDAALWASWGVDFLKYDYCHAPASREAAVERYGRMGEALRASGREILYAACEWGQQEPWLWARDVGAHSWRITKDVIDSWLDMQTEYGQGIGILGAVDRAEPLLDHSGPGGWNDLDMLVTGLAGTGWISGPGSTPNEYRTQVAMWCLLCSPLMIGADVRSMAEHARSLLTNSEVLALNQDPLAQPARRVASNRDGIDVWRKPLVDGRVALGLLNRATSPIAFRLDQATVGLEGPAIIRDLWSRQDIGELRDILEVVVEPHDTRLIAAQG